MSGDRGLRWPLHARAQLAGALLVALLSALVLIAAHSGWVLPSGGGGRPVAIPSRTPLPRMTTGALPQAAVGPVSAALGAAQPSYHVHPGASGAHALNRGQGFAASFGDSGVRVSSKSLALSMHTVAAGFGAATAAVAPVRPQVASNRVTYHHPGLREWYANGPFGLEQGFSVARPAASSQRDGVYTVTLALSSTTAASLGRDGRSLLLHTRSGGTLRYGGLRALDAANRLLPSWLSLRGGSVSLHVRTAGARFPVSIDPLLTGEGLAIELGQGPGEAPEKPQFGTSVALSGDGTTALVGAPAGTFQVGSAWIFHREGAKWEQQGPELKGPATGEEGGCEGEEAPEEGEEPVSCAFGSSVALDYKGDTALIGAPRKGSKPGVVWVLNRTGSTWAEEEVPLSGPAETGQQGFGFSVALSSDGNHAIVGAPQEHGGKGEAYVFERIESGAWTGAVPLVASPEGQGHLGFSVAMSANGQEAVVGAPLDALKKGTAFIFEHVGLKWEQIGGPLTGKGEVGEGRFGESVAMAGNGTAVLVGAPSENNKVGAVWTFVFRTGRWSEFEKLNGPGGAKEEFGRGVALSNEAKYALIGAPKANAEMRGVGAGAVSLYTAENFEWSEKPEVIEAGPLEKGNGQFGKSVSMTENGQTVLVGAPHEAFKAGAVWLFGKRPTVEKLQLSGGSTGRVKGRLSGGNKIDIIGKNLVEATAVWFGPNKSLKIEERAGANEEGQERLEVLVPPGDEEGEVDVTVETADWLSAVNTNDVYTYVRIASEENQGGGGGGGGGGPKNHPGKNNEEPLENILHPKTTTTTTTTTTKKPNGGIFNEKSSGSPSCTVSLRSSKVSVAKHSRATISLAAHGAGSCGGRITLQASVKKGKRTQTKTIASGFYGTTGGRNLSVALKLNSTGQALLRAGHGHLKAKLLIARSTPTALRASTTNVTLSLAKKKG